MTSKIIDWLFGRSTGEEPVQLVTSNPDQVGEALTAARREIEKLRGDREFAEGRFRQEIEALRDDTVALRKELTSKNERIEALLLDVEKAEASADEKARAQLRRAGHDPVPVDKEPAEGAIVAQYRALKPGKDREAFRETHLATLLKAGALKTL